MLIYIFIYKDTPTQVFSCKFCEIFKNTFSYRTPRLAISIRYKYLFCDSVTDVFNSDFSCQGRMTFKIF